VWLLGSSDYSAHLAARMGRPYAFAAHFSPSPPELPMLAYRQRFRPGALEKPYAMLAVSVFCADTDAAAERLARAALVSFATLRTGRPVRLMRPDDAMAYTLTPAEAAASAGIAALQIVGTPDAVRAKVTALVERTRADEVMVATFAADPVGRLRSYELVAEALGGDR
jgi:luciferase family oxidoreductase group 1